MIFIANFLLLLVEAFICKAFKKEKLFIFLAFIQMGCLLAFRGINVGIDTPAYHEAIRYIGEANSTYGFEMGDVFLIRFLYSIFQNIQGVIAGYSIITLAATFYALNKMSNDTYLPIILFSGMIHYNFAFTGMRQALAISLIMIAMTHLLNHERIKSTILTVLASFFHISALLFLPLIVIDYFKITKLKHIGLLAVSSFLFLYFFAENLVEIGSVLFTDYAGYVDKYMNFQTSYNLIFYLFILIVCIWKNAKIKEANVNKNTTMIFSLLIGVGLYIMAIRFRLCNRLALYFTAPVYALIPNLINSNPKNASFNKLIFIGMSFAYLIALIIVKSNNVVPYTFFWEPSW